ncbi:MAG: invasion associated locus B family protein [Alphaproteobacteria bacterium]
MANGIGILHRAAAGLAVAATLAVLAGNAAAQEERRYRDWTLRCDVMAETHQRVCWIYNDATQLDPSLPEPVTVSVSVGFIPGSEPPVVHFHLCPPSAPNGSMLRVKVDDEMISELPLNYAQQVDCQVARSPEDEEAASDLLSAFRRGLEGQFEVVSPDGSVATIPLSLLGLTRALRNLEAIYESS